MRMTKAYRRLYSLACVFSALPEHKILCSGAAAVQHRATVQCNFPSDVKGFPGWTTHYLLLCLALPWGISSVDLPADFNHNLSLIVLRLLLGSHHCHHGMILCHSHAWPWIPKPILCVSEVSAGHGGQYLGELLRKADSSKAVTLELPMLFLISARMCGVNGNS